MQRNFIKLLPKVFKPTFINMPIRMFATNFNKGGVAAVTMMEKNFATEKNGSIEQTYRNFKNSQDLELEAIIESMSGMT